MASNITAVPLESLAVSLRLEGVARAVLHGLLLSYGPAFCRFDSTIHFALVILCVTFVSATFTPASTPALPVASIASGVWR